MGLFGGGQIIVPARLLLPSSASGINERPSMLASSYLDN